MLKRILVTIALLVPVALAGVWAANQAAPAAIAQSEQPAVKYDPTQTITVVGTGTSGAMPDVARVSVGADTTAATASEAVKQNGELMTAIMAVLKEMDIPDKDIQTTNFSIYMERYDSMPRLETEEATGPRYMYRVSNMVNVTIHDLEKVSQVLDGVIEAGANNIWGVNFALDDTAAAQAEARAKAVADAKDRAEALADLTGVQLGPVMSVSEVVSGSVVMAPVMMEYAVARGSGDAISPGEVQISYQVQVTYFIDR